MMAGSMGIGCHPLLGPGASHVTILYIPDTSFRISKSEPSCELP